MLSGCFVSPLYKSFHCSLHCAPYTKLLCLGVGSLGRTRLCLSVMVGLKDTWMQSFLDTSTTYVMTQWTRFCLNLWMFLRKLCLGIQKLLMHFLYVCDRLILVVPLSARKGKVYSPAGTQEWCSGMKLLRCLCFLSLDSARCYHLHIYHIHAYLVLFFWCWGYHTLKLLPSAQTVPNYST